MAETTKYVGVQKGNTVAEFVYDINQWIDKPDINSNSDELSLTSGTTKVRFSNNNIFILHNKLTL